MESEPPLAKMADTHQGIHGTAQLNTKLCAAFFALTDEARGHVSEAHVRISLLQQAFLEDIYPGLRSQQAIRRSLEEELEAAKREWEGERQALLHDLQESESSRGQLRESYTRLQESVNVQEGMLLQRSSEEAQLKAEYDKLSEEHVQLSKSLQKFEVEKLELLETIQTLETVSKSLQNFEEEKKELVERIQTFETVSKSLQKFEEEKQELVERIQTFEMANRELLQANDELSQKLSLSTERHAEEQEKTIRLVIQQEQLSTQIEELRSEKVRLQQSLEKMCEARSDAQGNSCTTAEHIRYWKRKHDNVCRQYASLLKKRLHQSLSTTGQLLKKDSNVVQPHTGSAKEFRETGSGKRAMAADNVELLARVRTKGRPWRNTRVRSPGCPLDPHDDFLDTPRDLAALNADEDGGVHTQLHQDEAIHKNGLGENHASNKLVSAWRQKIATARHRKDGQGAVDDMCSVASPQGKTPQVKKSKAQESIPTAGSVPRENGMPTHMGKTHLPIVANPQVEPAKEDLPMVADHQVEPAEEKQTSLMPGDSHTLKQKQKFQAVGFKYVEPVRKKRDREALPGAACQQCTRFYDAIFAKDADGTLLNRCEHYDEVSRHRYRYAPPPTPDGFWNIGFDSDL